MGKNLKLIKRYIVILGVLFISTMFSDNTYAENSDTFEAYIIPDSTSRYLDESEIINLPLQILNYAKNEVYAREGRIFRSSELQTYFEQQSWYHGTISPDVFDDSNMLNQYEYANTQLLSKVEHNINSSGYKLDQPGYSYEPVYQYIASRTSETSEDSETPETQAVISAAEYQFIGGETVDSVSFEEQYTEIETGIQYVYGEIKGLDSGGNVVWERKTDQYICAGYIAVSNIGEYGHFYYYAEGGKVVQLSKENGELRWEADAGAAVPMSVFGSDGTLYLSCQIDEAPDFIAINEEGTILNQVDEISDDYLQNTGIRYLGQQIAITCYGDNGDTIYLINLGDYSYYERGFDDELDWYGGITDFTEYEDMTGAKVIRYADEDIDGDHVTELLTCSADSSGKDRYYIWKKDQEMPFEFFSFTGEQEEAPVRALYYDSENRMLVVYNEQDSVQTLSFYGIEDSEVRLNYCVYRKRNGMKWEMYLYQSYSRSAGEVDRRVKMLEYGMENDEDKKAADIVWRGYIDKLSKFKFQKP